MCNVYSQIDEEAETLPLLLVTDPELILLVVDIVPLEVLVMVDIDDVVVSSSRVVVVIRDVVVGDTTGDYAIFSLYISRLL